MPEPTVDPKLSDNPQDPIPGDQNKDNLPEKFKGKSAEEIANSYIELEKKYSQTTQEKELTKKQLADLKALENFIDNDPESLQFLRERIKGKNGKQVLPQQDNKLDEAYNRLQADVTDAKLATQTTIFEKFEGKYGLTDDSDEVKTLKHDIGEAIKQMVAPKSAKTPTEIIAQLPLDTLPMYLENAYKLVTMDNQKEQVRRKALATARMNADGMFGNIPSSSLRQNSYTLSAEEKKVAKGLGISEEKYLAQKKQINAEYEE